MWCFSLILNTLKLESNYTIIRSTQRSKQRVGFNKVAKLSRIYFLPGKVIPIYETISLNLNRKAWFKALPISISLDRKDNFMTIVYWKFKLKFWNEIMNAELWILNCKRLDALNEIINCNLQVYYKQLVVTSINAFVASRSGHSVLDWFGSFFRISILLLVLELTFTFKVLEVTNEMYRH